LKTAVTTGWAKRTFFASRSGEPDTEPAFAVVDENEETVSELVRAVVEEIKDTDDEDACENGDDGEGFRTVGPRLRRVFMKVSLAWRMPVMEEKSMVSERRAMRAVALRRRPRLGRLEGVGCMW
jgi:hypothetical protein